MLERDDGLYQTGREMERDDGLYSEYREATQTRGVQPKAVLRESLLQHSSLCLLLYLLETKARRGDREGAQMMFMLDDDVYYYICWRLKLEGRVM